MRAALRPDDESLHGAAFARDLQSRFEHGDPPDARVCPGLGAKPAGLCLRCEPRPPACQLTPTVRLMVEPISALMTRSANSSCSVASRLMMTRRAPCLFANKGKPAAG